MVAITWWAASQAVVQAPMTTSRPLHSRVRPPSAPMLRDQRPSWISRRAARTRARVSRFIDRMDVKSLMTSRPAGADLGQQAAGGVLGAFLRAACRDSRAASPLMVETTFAPAPASGMMGLGLGGAAAADDQQPGRVAAERLGSRGGQHDIEGAEVVAVAEPLAVGVGTPARS